MAPQYFSSNAKTAVGRDWAQQDSRVQNHFLHLKANGSNHLDIDDHFKTHGCDSALRYSSTAVLQARGLGVSQCATDVVTALCVFPKY